MRFFITIFSFSTGKEYCNGNRYKTIMELYESKCPQLQELINFTTVRFVFPKNVDAQFRLQAPIKLKTFENAVVFYEKHPFSDVTLHAASGVTKFLEVGKYFIPIVGGRLQGISCTRPWQAVGYAII